MLVPILLGLAWNGQDTAFLVLLAISFFSDALDGWIARSFNLRTELGARLDSFSDFFLYGTMALGGWWLWPHIMLQERVTVLLLLACLLAPTLAGLLKFHRTTSYHTWAVKLSALAIGAGGLLLFAGGPSWPFHLALPVSLYAATEQIIITWISATPHSNVPTLWHAMRSPSA
ncbi:MAG: CDP-alcohol phosphatidyltransferase family protein [Granulosicoccus sp.]|nr:CDP-alcohol phosphatidyltransferase family protein [Granulosicoccus sp.]